MAEAPKRKLEKSLKDAEMPPLPFADKILKGEPEPEKEVTTVQEAIARIQKMRKYMDDVQTKVDEFYRVTGWNRKFVEEYANNPNNFTPAEWEEYINQRKETLARIMSSEELQKLEQKWAKKAAESKKSPADPRLFRERRKKAAGVRRNWLPMR